jgi:hypothetical protein
MYVQVYKFLAVCALILVGTALWLPREPEVLFGGSLGVVGLFVCLTQLREK